ncbi:MAG: hypothetical protein HQL42_11180 [Alphaproteobacteria bacterium]|nr:hypothetical protein [Alphaproteobacteria bacterium]
MTSWRPTLATAALLAVIAASIVRAVAHSATAGIVAAAALALYLILEGAQSNGKGRVMLVLGLVASAVTLAVNPSGLSLLLKAGAEAAAIIGLFTSLGFLREAAETSGLVQRCGELMVRQPPGRRYAVLTLGAHVISLVLNFGVLSLLGVMITKGNTLEAAGGEARIKDIRTRRMLSAILRGFALMTVWSPLSVSFAVVQTVVHDIAWQVLLPLQGLLAALLLVLGGWLDRREFPPTSRRFEPQEAGAWNPLFHLCLLIMAIVAASVGIAHLLEVRIVIGAMIVMPLAAWAWLAVQRRDPRAATAHLGRRVLETLPGFRNEVAMLGGAMFLGIVVAAYVPPAETARLLAALGLPPAALVVLLALAVMILAQFGVSQIISVTLIGGALADLAELGLPPLAVASGLMGAWALSACSTPVGAAVLTVARIGQVPVIQVARLWNGRFVLAGALLLSVWLVVICEMLGGA